MTLTQVLLGVVVASTGLFTGLLMTVLFFFERALKDLSGPEFAFVMQRFLKITRTHPLNYAMVLTSGIMPVTVLVMLRENLGSPSFVLTTIGLLAFWCGSILPSTFMAQPLYGVFMGWEIDAPPLDWQAARDRYFHVNVVRGLGSVAAFVCFVIAAMIVPL
jgi:predicted membrane channel-forming protein YqfA (hemolysin III family)